MKTKLMKCGHSANAIMTGTDGIKRDCCAICAPHPTAFEEATTPNLDGRIALCAYCRKEAPSNVDLPFFEYLPAKSNDRYYCGCRGWD